MVRLWEGLKHFSGLILMGLAALFVLYVVTYVDDVLAKTAKLLVRQKTEISQCLNYKEVLERRIETLEYIYEGEKK